MQRVNGDANEVMHFFIDGQPYLLFNIMTLTLTRGIHVRHGLAAGDCGADYVAAAVPDQLLAAACLWYAYGPAVAGQPEYVFGSQRRHHRGAGGQSLRPEPYEDRRFDKVNNRLRTRK